MKQKNRIFGPLIPSSSFNAATLNQYRINMNKGPRQERQKECNDEEGSYGNDTNPTAQYAIRKHQHHYWTLTVCDDFVQYLRSFFSSSTYHVNERTLKAKKSHRAVLMIINKVQCACSLSFRLFDSSLSFSYFFIYFTFFLLLLIHLSFICDEKILSFLFIICKMGKKNVHGQEEKENAMIQLQLMLLLQKSYIMNYARKILKHENSRRFLKKA